MPRLSTIVFVLAIGALIAGGVIEVKFNPEAIAQLPARLKYLAFDPTVRQEVRTRATALKRTGEQWIIRDEEKRLELARAYVAADTAEVSQLLKAGSDAPALVAAAERLLGSIERVAMQSAKLPLEKLAAGGSATKDVVSQAIGVVAELKKLKEADEALRQRFASVVSQLEQYVGRLAGGADREESAVAGKRDETPAINAVPLSF